MEKDIERPPRRRHHLRVPVFPDEKAVIEAQAHQAGLSVAAFLRDVGQGYPVRSVLDYEQVRELVRINADLGRLGGLLKLWLADSYRVRRTGTATIVALLERIEETRAEMSRIMQSVVLPGTKS